MTITGGRSYATTSTATPLSYVSTQDEVIVRIYPLDPLGYNEARMLESENAAEAGQHRPLSLVMDELRPRYH